MALERTFAAAGLTNPSKIATTLQGSIWRATHDSSIDEIVVKVSNKSLHQKSIVVVDGQKYMVHENIISEMDILKYLTTGPESKSCPNSIVKYIGSLQSDTDYLLLMDFGGGSLMEFVIKIHEYIKSGHIAISEWRKVVRIIYSQMIECIEYIHSRNVCHLDISLENWLINDCKVKVEKDGKGHQLSFCTDDIQIKLCDFGLAVLFDEDSTFESTKYCGKSTYKSPEIANQKIFNAKSNDLWCLGVCVFMLTVGCPPWEEPTKKSESFNYIMNGYLIELLRGWNKMAYVDDDLIVLFESIFQMEGHRCSLDAFKESTWYSE
eukprot:17591_1